MPDPNGLRTYDSECVDSAFGNAESYLVTDVPAFARADLNASDAPGSLAIGGLSAGATCSVVLALVHPTVYPTFASFSGFLSPRYHETDLADTIRILFGGSTAAFDRHDPLRLLAGATTTAQPGGSRSGTGTPSHWPPPTDCSRPQPGPAPWLKSDAATASPPSTPSPWGISTIQEERQFMPPLSSPTASKGTRGY